KVNHSLHLQQAIHKAIKNGEHDERSTGLRVPLAHIKVLFDESASAALSTLSARVFQAYGEIGYRKHKQIRALAAGHAINRTWKHPQIEKQDIEFIEKCLPFLIEGSQI